MANVSQRVCFVALLCCAVLVQSSRVHAQIVSGVGGEETRQSVTPEETLETARGLGMGMGVRAGVVGTSALAYNPANLGRVKAYHIDAISGLVAKENAWSIGTAVADSASSSVAMGTSFRGVFGNGDREYKGWDWRTGLGVQLAKQLGLGIGIRYAKIKAKRDANDQPIGPKLKAFTMDVSLTATPIEWLSIAALGYNLIDTHSVLAPRQVGGSVAIAAIQSLQLGTDILVDLTSFEDPELLIGAGIEYFAANAVAIRAGYRRDAGRDLHQITASLGYVSQQFGIEAGLRQGVNDPKETQLVFSLRYQVQ
ncbi:MAG: hypothetical protein R3A47_09585 [Polyangiales bacterium]